MSENSGNITCDYMYLSAIKRRLKSYTRSTMIPERLNGIALMHSHQELVPDIQKVIDLFAVSDRNLTSFDYWYLVNILYLL